MKDRIPTYPGRVRLTPVSGQENVYDLERADEPTQEGTPLNKSTLLKDSTAIRLGGDETMTVDESINSTIDESGFAVGDFVEGYDLLNDYWEPFEEKIIEEEDYPALFSILPYSVASEIETLPEGSGNKDSGYQAYENVKLFEVNGYEAYCSKETLFYRLKGENEWSSTNWTGIRNFLTVYSNMWSMGGIVYDEGNDEYGVLILNVTKSGYRYSRILFVSDLSQEPQNDYISINTGNDDSDNTQYWFRKLGGTYFFRSYYTMYSNTLRGTWSRMTDNQFIGIDYIDDRYVEWGCRANGTNYYPCVRISNKNPTTYSSASWTTIYDTVGSGTSLSYAYSTIAVAYLSERKLLLTSRYKYVTGWEGGMIIDLSGTTPTKYGTHKIELIDSNTSGMYIQICKTAGGYVYTKNVIIRDTLAFPLETVLDSAMPWTLLKSRNLVYLTDDLTYRSATSLMKLNMKQIVADALSFKKMKVKGSPALKEGGSL